MRAAIGRVREAAPGRPTMVCGWSFGASVALREALDDSRVSALALVGMPPAPGRPDAATPLPHPAELRRLRRQVLVLAGDGDGYCPADEAKRFVDSLPDARLHLVRGSDHYLWRREREAAAIVGGFVDEVLAGS